MTAFRIWGLIGRETFDQTFPSANAWRAGRSLNERRYEVEVLGMKSEATE